jgi:hypothetical protein
MLCVGARANRRGRKQTQEATMTTATHDAPILIPIPEAARRLALGKTTLYATVLQPRGPVPVIKIGAASRVRVADLERWAEQEAAAAREVSDGQR